MDELLNHTRREKDNLESQLASMQERVQRAFCEIDRLKEQLTNSNEQFTVASNNAKSALIDLQWQRDKWHEEVAALTSELKSAKEAETEAQSLCQKYVEEKRQLADVLSETQMCLANVRKSLEETKSEMHAEVSVTYFNIVDIFIFVIFLKQFNNLEKRLASIQRRFIDYCSSS